MVTRGWKESEEAAIGDNRKEDPNHVEAEKW